MGGTHTHANPPGWKHPPTRLTTVLPAPLPTPLPSATCLPPLTLPARQLNRPPICLQAGPAPHPPVCPPLLENKLRSLRPPRLPTHLGLVNTPRSLRLPACPPTHLGKHAAQFEPRVEEAESLCPLLLLVQLCQLLKCLHMGKGGAGGSTGGEVGGPGGVPNPIVASPEPCFGQKLKGDCGITILA